MKINKCMALFLSLCIIFSIIPAQIVVHAEETYKFVTLPIVANGNRYNESVILYQNTLYMNANDVSKCTRYQFNKDNMRFLLANKNELYNVFKYIKLYPESNVLSIYLRINTESDLEIKLDRIINYNNSYYLPIYQIIPCLDVFVSVKDNALCIDAPNISMSEAMYGFDPQKYMFDIKKEHLGSMAYFYAYYIPNYLYDTVSKIRVHRALSIKGSYFDYDRVIASLLQNDDIYLRAVSGEQETVKDILDVFSEIYDFSDRLNSGFEVAEHIGEVIQVGDQLYDLKALSEAGSHNNLGVILDYSNFFYYYYNHIEDHYNMIERVYNSSVNKKRSLTDDPEYSAASIILSSYSQDVRGRQIGTMYSTIKSAIDIAGDETLGLYSAVAQVGSTILESTVDNLGGNLKVSEKIALLPIYNDVMLSAWSAYDQYKKDGKKAAKEDIDNIRLCAIMFLLASRECFLTMDETVEGVSYEDTINKIEAKLISFYQASVSTELTSFDYVKKTPKELKKQLKAFVKDNFKDGDNNISSPEKGEDVFYSSSTQIVGDDDRLFYISCDDNQYAFDIVEADLNGNEIGRTNASTESSLGYLPLINLGDNIYYMNNWNNIYAYNKKNKSVNSVYLSNEYDLLNSFMLIYIFEYDDNLYVLRPYKSINEETCCELLVLNNNNMKSLFKLSNCGCHCPFFINNNHVYMSISSFQDNIPSGIYCYDLNSNISSITDGDLIYSVTDEFIYDLVVFKDTVFAAYWNDSNETECFFRCNTDGSDIFVIEETAVQTFGIYNNMLYYNVLNAGVYRSDLFGNNKEFICPGNYMSGIAKGWILLENGELFKIPEPDKTKDQKNIDSAEQKKYADTFFNNYNPNKDLVYLYDVTNDGKEDLIVVDFDDQNYSGVIQGIVYTTNDDKVEEIYRCLGGETHGDGFFNWYIRYIDGKAYIAHEFDNMFQGTGVVGLITKRLQNDGSTEDIDKIYLEGYIDFLVSMGYDEDYLLTYATADDYETAYDSGYGDKEREYKHLFIEALQDGKTLYSNYPDNRSDIPPLAESALSILSEAYNG